MAAEALDLPRNASITIRLPHRLRVLLRALRIARKRRAPQLYRSLANHDERMMADVGLHPRCDARYRWLNEMMGMRTDWTRVN